LKELYKRFIVPFYIPLLVLIPFLLTISSKENKNYTKIKIITFILGVIFIIISETSIKMISDIILRNSIISFLPFIFIIIFYLIFINQNKLKTLL